MAVPWYEDWFDSEAYELVYDQRDLSETALRTARQRADREGLTVAFRQADMRHLPFEAAFDGAVNLFTTFGYFEDDAEHQDVIDGIARSLRPGGWFVQDFLNAPYALSHLVPEDERTVGGVRIAQRRWVEDGAAGRRINKEITLHRNGDAHAFTESVRLLTLADFRRMYAAAGLALRATFGDYDGGPHTPTSPRLILVARKAVGS
jgi:SAM-dependent methyltransferase